MSATARGEPIRLMETFRSLFYTPIYTALSGGFFQREGLDVEFSTCPSGQHGFAFLNNGTADIVQGGPMRSLIAADWGAEVVPAHFIEINSRDGFFLVGRAPQGEFQWSDLNSATLIPAGFSPMPRATLKYALKLKGVDLEELHLIDGLSLQEAMDVFRRGEADFIQLPQPSVEQLVDEGAGHLAAALAPVSGHISFSSFVTTHRFLSTKTDIVQRFTQGFYNAQKWLSEHDAQTVGEAVGSFFPAVESRLIVKAVARYKEQDTWAKDPLL